MNNKPIMLRGLMCSFKILFAHNKAKKGEIRGMVAILLMLFVYCKALSQSMKGMESSIRPM